jgi:hypothetical protein
VAHVFDESSVVTGGPCLNLTHHTNCNTGEPRSNLSLLCSSLQPPWARSSSSSSVRALSSRVPWLQEAVSP